MSHTREVTSINNTDRSIVFAVMIVLLLLSSAFLIYAFAYREDIQYTDISFALENGVVFDLQYEDLEDGYEFGFILPESVTNVQFTIILSDYFPNKDRGEFLDEGRMWAQEIKKKEFKGKSEISLRTSDYVVGISGVYLYISGIDDTIEGQPIDAQFFEQRGSLFYRTGVFIISSFIFAMFWVIFYGSMAREIKMIIRDYRRAGKINSGKLEASPGAKDKDKAMEFLFGEK